MKFKHLGVAISKIDGTLEAYRAILGYKLLSGPFTDPIQKASVCFLGTDNPGDAVIELITPLTEDSPLKSVLARGGGPITCALKLRIWRDRWQTVLPKDVCW